MLAVTIHHPLSTIHYPLKLSTITWFRCSTAYADIITQNRDNSNLLVATIPVGQAGHTTDEPRYVAVTSDRQRAYTTLESSNQIAVIDLLTMRQIDGSHAPDAAVSLPDSNPTLNSPSGISRISSRHKAVFTIFSNRNSDSLIDIKIVKLTS